MAQGGYLNSFRSRLIAPGGDAHVYSSSEARKVAISSNRERWHACSSAFWQAPCDDSLGAAVPLEVSLVRVFPKRGKCVGLAGSCVNASVSRRFIRSEERRVGKEWRSRWGREH